MASTAGGDPDEHGRARGKVKTGERLHRIDRRLHHGGRPGQLARFLDRGWVQQSSTGDPAKTTAAVVFVLEYA